ncbi:transporter substrate-binding domain-containing protein [Pseudomonas sp. BN417]|uniref:ATP-binding protein n=1 Tax=Pseudomonas sp. BN417 TaxID=2567890 RepID=UPI002454C2D4|nr:transporter substrate-binding domain-containing protein [Pseudomonas sp. BN417]MDH4556001.1 transporter substrate-binding domain-containing protein [Pseudomonas sp. BN417]
MPTQRCLSRRGFRYFCLAAGLLLAAATLRADPQAPALTLSSPLTVDHQALAISEEDWRWLRDKRELVMGVPVQGVEPLEIIQRDGSYEGVVADATTLVSQLLGLQIRLRQYPDRQALLDALLRREVDFVVGSGAEGERDAVAHSRPLVRDRLALFRRYKGTDDFPKDLKDVTVVATADLAPFLAQRYPDAHRLEAKSIDDAMAMVSFGQADLLLDDFLSVSFRVNRVFNGLLEFDRFPEAADTSLGFIVRAEDQVLLRGLDGALRAAGQTWLDDIVRSWVGSGLMPLSRPLSLSPAEARWVRQNPVVRLVIDDDMAPGAYFDEEGRFRGFFADLLDVVTLQTGLHFTVISRSGSVTAQVESLLREEADLAILSPSSTREGQLRFSRAIASVPFVLVGRVGIDAPLDNPVGVRIAMARSQIAREELSTAYPGSELIESASSLDAMNLVSEGAADYAVVAMPTARYYIPHLFNERLTMPALANIRGATVNFAVRRADGELQSIIDRVMASLPPGEINAMASRWRGAPGMSPQTWRDYDTLIQRIILGAVLAVLLVLGWVLYQRHEIHRRRVVERQLNDELRFIETLTDSMPPPLYVRDTEGRLLSCNRSYLASIGLPLESVRGRTALDLPAEVFEAAPEFHGLYLQAMAEGRMIQGVHEVGLEDRELWIDHWVQPFQDSTGAVKGVICGWLDITEHRHLVEELEAAKNLADEASRAKTTFLATMSHEIRTPMNAVIGILELALKRADDRPIDRASIEVAYGSARGLLVLIGDILDIARIESGRLSLAPHRANLRELVESVARVFDGLARQKRLSLELEIDASIQGDVLVDGMRFKQIVSNLVSNAIKFTDEGSVRLSIQGAEPEAGVLQVNFSVEDSGIGISPADQERLFRPFAQVQRGQRQSEGTGLGLVICRSLCEMMGGRLTLSSTPGTGTRVDVELRLQRLDPVEEPAGTLAARERERRRLRVLVVDDHPVNRQILAQQLGFLGHEVTEAENGEDALALWRTRPFDVVATDCHMPRMNGAELARAIREEERDGQRAPTLILGLTADAQPEEVARGIQAGMDECLIKPIGLDLLEEKLCAASGGEPALESDAEPATVEADALPLFDLAPLAPLTGGDAGLVRNLVNELLETNRRDLVPLAELVERGDAPGLAELAHRLKGAARVVRAEQLIDACVRLEQVCKSSQLEALGTAAEALRQAMLALERGLLAQLAGDAQ